MKTIIFYLFLFLSIFSTEFLRSQTTNNKFKFTGDEIIAYCYQPIDGSGLHQIYTIHADGSENFKIIDAEIGLNHHNWSPDGIKMAAVGYIGTGNATWSIHVFDTDGSNLTRLTDTENVWDNDPAWSPDGEQICFSRIYPDQNYFEEIWLMDNQGNNPVSIGIEGGSAKWSPDGTRFIYHSRKSGNLEIYTCNIDGTNEQQITNTPGLGKLTPVWSPDGNNIAYTQVTDEIRYDICTMNPDGQNIQCLTCELEYGGMAPKWSPDGSMIAFLSGPFEEWEIFIINVDGSNLQQVTNSSTGITAINPDWKPQLNSSTSSQQLKEYKIEVFPNPFSISTIIKFSFVKNTSVDIQITDSKGKEVFTLSKKIKKSSAESLNWNGRNSAGEIVPAGVYIISISFDDIRISRKLFKSN